jgi:hypothetical protein
MMVMGGAAVEPHDAAWAVRTEQRIDLNGRPFCEVVERRLHDTAADARRAAEVQGGGREVVGLDPWQPAFPLPALKQMRLVFEAREPGQAPGESPMVRIFEIVP